MAKRKVADASSEALAPASARKLRRTRANVRSGMKAEESVYFERGRACSANFQEDERPAASEQSSAPRTSARKLASLKSTSTCNVAPCSGPAAADCVSSRPADVPGRTTGPFKFVAHDARTPRVAIRALDDDVVHFAGLKSTVSHSIRVKAEYDARDGELINEVSDRPTEKSVAATVSSRSSRRKQSSDAAAAGASRKRSIKTTDDSIAPASSNEAKPTDWGNKDISSSVDLSSGTSGDGCDNNKKTKKLSGNRRGRRPAVGGLSAAAVKRDPRKAKSIKQPTKQREPTVASVQSDDSGSDEASNDEWEEVEELMGEDQMIKSQLPSKPVEVLLDVPDIPGLSKRKKKTFDIHAYLRRKWKKFKKEQHENTHKVHLLCFLSYGIQLNKICNHPLLQSAALSLCTREGLLSGDVTIPTLTSRAHWFNLRVSKSANTEQGTCVSIEHLESELMDDMSKLTSRTSVHHALIFLLLLRACGVAARLVLAVHPIPWKISDLKKESVRKSPSCQMTSALPDARQTVKEDKPVKRKGKKANAAMSTDNAGNTVAASTTAGSKRPEKGNEDPVSDHKSRTPRRSCAAVKSYREKAEQLTDSDENDEAAGVSLVRRSTASRKVAEDEESDVDFTSKPGGSVSCKAAKKRHASVSGDESVQLWLEVYIDKPGKWICLDVAGEVFDTTTYFESRSSRPFTYVISYDNDGCIKDVTQRYASMWMSVTQKLRVDQEWWCETLAAYRTCNLARDQAEDAQMLSLLEKRPFPTSVAEFKGHPLYALKRHLLKFEAIYPETAVPLGYIKGEAIYARECVHTLHSRETWLKHAKSIRIGEKPYKMVKPRPKMNKPDDHKGEATLGVFGSWQVEDFQPPVATGGKVPRNEYGNVELFKPCMIPVGCVHLPIPGLHRVAKKLDIDVAPAMVGWEGYCGYSVPQFDGWIVCEEFKDTLLAAWEEYEAEERRKQTEKKEKRVLGNWTLLVRGLLIKEKLKGRFNLTDNKETSSAEGEKADDIHKAWPRNMNTSTKESAVGSSSALFPFEQM